MSILLVGCGYWGKNWYNTIKNSKYDLWGVVDPKPMIDVDVPLYSSMDEILHEGEHFTHAIIATPVQYHFDTHALLRHMGIPDENILVEKPCGISKEHADMMQDSYPGYIFLHDPIYQYIKENIHTLGKIITFDSIRASMGPRIRTDVSILEDYLIHDLYILLDLFGLTNEHGFFDMYKPDLNFRRNHFLPPIQESEINLFFETYSNMIVKMFSSWWWPKKERRIVIVGTEGSYIWENEQLIMVNEYYDELGGTIDKFGNIDHELVQNEQQFITRDILTYTTGHQKSNLELELEAFMENKKPFSDELMLNVWKFVERIKGL